MSSQVMDKACMALARPGAEEHLRQALIEVDGSGLGYVTKQQLQVGLLGTCVRIILSEINAS